MKRVLLGVVACLSLFGADVPPGAQRWWAHVQFLADDRLQGRDTGSEGHRLAAEYVAAQFQKAGLQPGGTTGYVQPVKFHTRRILEDKSSLALVRDGKVETLTLGDDANIGVRSDPAPSLEAPLVFAGYGFVVPEMKHNDLAGLDLKGKVVVYLTGSPSNIPGPLRAHYQSVGERWKFLRAAGAVGTVTIQNPNNTDVPWARSTLSRTKPAMSLADPELEEPSGRLSVTANAARAEKWFTGSGHTFREILALADQGKPLPTFPLPASIRSQISVERGEVESQNVVGIRPGSDPKLKDEHVVISAHLDHVGVGTPINGDGIYNGAMDNASGVAALMEIAAALHDAKAQTKRSLVFVAVTGEEKGLAGSRYYAAHPTVKGTLVANLNMDMFLPLFPLKLLLALGAEESDLGDRLREVLRPRGIELQPDPEPQRNRFIRSDQYSFIRKGIPSLAFKVGYTKDSKEAEISRKWTQERYHGPTDDLKQPMDLQAAADFCGTLSALAVNIANHPQRPRWKEESFFKRFAK